MAYTDYTVISDKVDVLAGLAKALAAANEGRRIDVEPAPTPVWKTPPAAAELDPKTGDEVSPAVDGVVAEYAIGIRVNDDGPEPVWPQGVAARPRRDGDPGFAIPDSAAIQMVPTADDVRVETERRLMVAFNARTPAHLAIKVQDVMMQANWLTDKLARGSDLTPEEQELAAYLRGAVAMYFAIKTTGNDFEAAAAAGAIRPDWRNNSQWPLLPEVA